MYDRVHNMNSSDTMRERERDLLVRMLYNREPAFTVDRTEIWLFSSEIEPRHVIRTMPQNGWQ